MKQLVTFKISDGGQEYESFGIYDHWDIFWNLINDQVKQNNGFRIGG